MPRKKPDTRNLYRRGETWHLQVGKGRGRQRLSLKTTDLETARRRRDVLLEERRKKTEAAEHGDRPVPTLGEFAPVYLAYAKRDHKQSTAHTHHRFLTAADGKRRKKDGVLYEAFGDTPLDEITPAAVVAFWDRKRAEGKSESTLRNYLVVLGGCLGYAKAAKRLIPTNPVREARQDILDLRKHTSKRRAARGTKVCPLSDKEIATLLANAREAFDRAERRRRDGKDSYIQPDQNGYLAILLMLDGGLRRGEVAALRWGDIGRDSVAITKNVASGRFVEELTKTGDDRDVELSKRLRHALAAWRVQHGSPGDDEPLLPEFDARNFLRRQFKKWCPAGHTPKCLRQTFASQLLSMGVPIGHIAQQLGHVSTETTSRHYARWIPKELKASPTLDDGEVWADLLVRVAA